MGIARGTVAIVERKTREERIAATKARIEAIADLKAKADARATETRRNRLEEQFDRAYGMSPEAREKIAKDLFERGRSSERTNVEAAKDYYLFAFQLAPGAEVSQQAHDALKRLDGLAKPAAASRGQGLSAQTLLSEEELTALRQQVQQAAGSNPEAEEEILRLLEQLNEIPNERSQRLVIDRLRDQAGNSYSDALARAIQLTKGSAQDYARQALVDRFQRFSVNVLMSKLRSDDEEIQFAAAQAASTKTAELAGGLIELIDKSERVSQAARKSLQTLTGQDYGPAPGASTAERFAARQRWQRWAKQP